MNTQNPTETLSTQAIAPESRLRYWLVGIVVLLTFALADVLAVALPAMALSVAQSFAIVAAFVLISGGSIYTVWQLKG